MQLDLDLGILGFGLGFDEFLIPYFEVQRNALGFARRAQPV